MKKRQCNVHTPIYITPSPLTDSLFVALFTVYLSRTADRLLGPLEKSSRGGYRTTKMPFVFLLGNHSSGKSSFINFCLGRNIQKAGVAPTDDSFTVIAPVSHCPCHPV